MVEDRLLLCEDAGTEEARLMQAGITRGVPVPPGFVLPAVEPLKQCSGKKHHHDKKGHHDDKDHHDDRDRDDERRD